MLSDFYHIRTTRMLSVALVPLFLLLFSGCGTLPAPEVYKQTVPQQHGRFVFVGDTQRTLWLEFWREQNDEIRENLLGQIAQEQPAAVILLGDMTSWGASQQQWAYFDGISTPIRTSGIPLFALMGNHEYMGSNAAGLENVHARFARLKESTWYSFVTDSLAFVMLNSNFSDLSNQERAAQKQWLDSILNSYNAASSVLAIVCCWHHPAYTNSTVVEDDEDVHSDFLEPILRSPKVQLIASGHAHAYEHFFNHNKDFLVSGGGGGPRQELNQGNDLLHQDKYTGAAIRDFHYCIVERQGLVISVTMMRYDASTATWQKGDSWITTSASELPAKK